MTMSTTTNTMTNTTTNTMANMTMNTTNATTVMTNTNINPDHRSPAHVVPHKRASHTSKPNFQFHQSYIGRSIPFNCNNTFFLALCTKVGATYLNRRIWFLHASLTTYLSNHKAGSLIVNT